MKKIDGSQILRLLLLLAGALCLALAISGRGDKTIYLPLALVCILAGNVLNLLSKKK